MLQSSSPHFPHGRSENHRGHHCMKTEKNAFFLQKTAMFYSFFIQNHYLCGVFYDKLKVEGGSISTFKERKYRK